MTRAKHLCLFRWSFAIKRKIQEENLYFTYLASQVRDKTIIHLSKAQIPFRTICNDTEMQCDRSERVTFRVHVDLVLRSLILETKKKKTGVPQCLSGLRCNPRNSNAPRSNLKTSSTTDQVKSAYLRWHRDDTFFKDFAKQRCFLAILDTCMISASLCAWYTLFVRYLIHY